MTCHNLITATSTTEPRPSQHRLARAAGDQPILSVDTLFAARTSFISRQPMPVVRVRRPLLGLDHWCDPGQTRHR